MNEEILGSDSLFFKRFFNLDTRTYEEGALPARTKEMLGLATSMVLRCDDCIKYHLEKCFDLGINRDELFEIMAVANLVGGSIVIPHTRRALEYWGLLESEAAGKK
jgi:alkylhydroperoxidase AhpD family core domain